MTREIAFDDRFRQQAHFTTCYMCACRCGIKVTVEENRVRFIEGNRSHPVNHGVICAKGSAGIMKQYSPARLSKPLKRRPDAERGTGDFVEIEWDEALLKHPAVLEAAAVGVSDPHYGQDIAACVVLKRGEVCTEDALREHCLRELGRYKTPRILRFVDDLPKGPSGKVQRLKLLDLL